MKLVLASTSAVKITACRSAFPEAEIIPVKIPSGVPEQPVGDETLKGAFNRINGARCAVPDADLYVSIENGLFEEQGAFVDRAVVVTSQGGETPQVCRSAGVAFPPASVAETRRRGFDRWTVGKVMAEQGIVARHDDPHLSLSGKSRAAYIDDALAEAAAQWRRRGAAPI